jgi:hypothetical protein
MAKSYPETIEWRGIVLLQPTLDRPPYWRGDVDSHLGVHLYKVRGGYQATVFVDGSGFSSKTRPTPVEAMDESLGIQLGHLRGTVLRLETWIGKTNV